MVTPALAGCLGLRGRSAIVTGAARGIGLGGVARLVAEGVHVLAWDLDGEPFDSVLALATDETRVLAFRGDVARSADWEAAVAAAHEAFGRIDILFSNAGISGPTRPVSTYAEEDFDRVMAVNARGVFLGLKHVGAYMAAREAGVIVNVSSISGMGGGGNIFAYTASKHAVIGMTKSAAVHYAPRNVRVVALCPCPTNTEMMAFAERSASPDDPSAARPMFQAAIPLGRYGEPADVANVLAFVASDQAAFLTGAIIPVDGGLTAR